MKKLKAAAAVLLAAVMIMAVSVTAFAKTQTPFDNSEFFEYGDYSVHYRVFEAKGDFRGRIMMLHGFGCSTYSWEPMAKLMSENGYECVPIFPASVIRLVRLPMSDMSTVKS